MATTADPSTNGTGEPGPDDSPLARLRERPVNPHGFKGYGPLLAMAILLALVVALAPSVAPEEVVLKPSGPTTTVDLVKDPATTTTTAPTTTTAAVAP
jgi:hypothetical protein